MKGTKPVVREGAREGVGGGGEGSPGMAPRLLCYTVGRLEVASPGRHSWRRPGFGGRAFAFSLGRAEPELLLSCPGETHRYGVSASPVRGPCK